MERYLVGKEIRSDAYGNQWIRDPNFKKRGGWRPVSQDKFKRLCSYVCLFVGNVRYLVQRHSSLEKFCKSVCTINKHQWDRRHLFLQKQYGMADFREWTHKNHKDLPPLR